jgi:hypothetical protein
VHVQYTGEPIGDRGKLRRCQAEKRRPTMSPGFESGKPEAESGNRRVKKGVTSGQVAEKSAELLSPGRCSIESSRV